MKRELASELLLKTIKERRDKNRVLTSHVATRYYRAPELILMEKDYGKAVDIWSAGVIFGELLMMIEANCPKFAERNCLFPGGYCFPLSPKRNQKLDEDGIPIDTKNDQLEHIFALIGTPNETDTSFVTDEKARLYLNQFAPKSPDFEKRFPSCEPSGLKLLAEMLQFNPFFRPTIEECLQSPYFEKVSQFSAV